MIKQRKKFSLFFAIIACVCLAFAYGCNGGGKTDVVLVNFEDETKNIDYGSDYDLPMPVAFDAKGTEYKVEYEIKTNEGKVVRPYYNKFTADLDVGKKYTVTCKAIITEKASIMRTITLAVVDTIKPTGEFVDTLIGEVEKEYILPMVKLSDNVPKTSIDITAVALKDSKGTEIEIADGKFTPTAEGVYDYRVDFKDGGGNTNYISEKIYIRNTVVGRYLFDDFAHEYSTTAIKTVENKVNENGAEYLENYEEKTGVVAVKSTLSKTGPKYYIKINRTYEQLVSLNIEYLYFRIKLVYTGTSIGYYNVAKRYRGNYQADTWFDFIITREEIEHKDSDFAKTKNKNETAWEAFCRKATSANGVLMFDINDTDGTAENDLYTLYIDEFGYKGIFVPEKQFDDEYILGDEVELKATVFDMEDYTMKYTVISPDGETVALSAENKLRALQMGKYKVHAEIEHATETGSADFVFVVKTDGNAEIILEAYESNYELGERVVIPNATCTVNNQQKTVNYKVVDESGYGEYITIENDGFNAEYYGDFIITYTAKVGEFIYAKVITITVNGRPLGDYRYEDFGTPATLLKVENNGGVDFEKRWLSEYEGERGVMELTTKSAGQMLAYVEPKNDVKDYAYLAIKMWLPDEETTPVKIKYAGYWSDYWMISGDTTNERGRWITYYIDAINGLVNGEDIPIERENELKNLFATMKEGKHLRIIAYGCGKGAKIYISDMYFTNGIETLGAQVKIYGDVSKYKTITITSDATEGIDGLKITITNPKGVKTVLGVDGKYCPTEIGEHKVKVSAGNCQEVYDTNFTVSANNVSDEELQDDFFE